MSVIMVSIYFVSTFGDMIRSTNVFSSFGVSSMELLVVSLIVLITYVKLKKLK